MAVVLDGAGVSGWLDMSAMVFVKDHHFEPGRSWSVAVWEIPLIKSDEVSDVV